MAFLPLKFYFSPCLNWFCAKRLYKAELFHKCLLAGCKWFLFTIDSINKGKMATESFPFSLFPPEFLQFDPPYLFSSLPNLPPVD